MQNIYYILWWVNYYLGLPDGLLARVAFQEQGQTWNFNLNAMSSAGGRGLMQLTAVAVSDLFRIAKVTLNPLDPLQAAFGAGIYLKWLYNQFGDWKTALAAYNWGYGNVRNLLNSVGYLNVSLLPNETQRYLSIAYDLGL